MEVLIQFLTVCTASAGHVDSTAVKPESESRSYSLYLSKTQRGREHSRKVNVVSNYIAMHVRDMCRSSY